jgi:hypothetical protein
MTMSEEGENEVWALKSKVTLLSTIVALFALQVLGCSLANIILGVTLSFS